MPLGTADSFALLAGSTITNTGPTTITGNIGLCCTGLATTGFGSVTQPDGAQHAGPGTVAETAQNDLDVAYANAAGQPSRAACRSRRSPPRPRVRRRPAPRRPRASW